MPTTIEVKTQRIVVNPPSGKIDVLGYGPQGPAGPAGPPGSGVVVAWPVVAPPLPEGQVHFTPSNTNLAGLRPSTDANSWIRFWQGPPNSIYIKSNSGPLTAGSMGEIYLDADRIALRSSAGDLTLAEFKKTGGITLTAGVNPLTLRAQDGANEGGEINFQGAGSYAATNIYMDRYANDLRLVHIGGNVISFSNGTMSANSVNIAGSAAIGINPGSIVYLGNAADARVWIGNDGELYDAGEAHTIGLRSLTDSARGTLKFGNGARLLGYGGYYQLSAAAGGDAYYDAVNHYFRSQAGGNYVTIQGDRITFAGGGGGWFMQDTLWIRAVGDKGVWLGGGFFGTDGGITVGRGGTTDTTWRAYFQSNLFCTSQVNSYEVESRAVSSQLWSSIMGFRNNPSTAQAGIAFHPGGVAPILKVYQNTNQMEFRTSDSGSWTGLVAAYFTVASTLRIKSDVIDLPIPRPVDVARALQPIWFRSMHDLIEPIPIYSDESEHLLIGSDFTTHTCGESSHCEGTQENPCVRMQRHNRGRVSLSAEQVEQVFPTIAQYDHEGVLAGYDVVGLVALLVGAIRNLADDVDYLKGLVA